MRLARIVTEERRDGWDDPIIEPIDEDRRDCQIAAVGGSWELRPIGYGER